MMVNMYQPSVVSVIILYRNYILNRFSDHYLFCCLVRELNTVRTCLPEPDEFSSCEDLIRNRPLRVSMWILGLSALLGNLFVIFWRVRPQQGKGNKSSVSIQSILVLNLAIADGLMGVYMLTIASADMFYRNIYIIYAEDWKSSFVCKLAGLLSVLSSEASVFFLTVISLDRGLSITMPFSQVKLNYRMLKVIVPLVWAVNVVLSLLPAVFSSYFGESFYGRSSVCLALPLTTQKPKGWEYSVAIFLGLNLVAFLIMMFCYLGIYISVKLSSKRVKTAAGKSRSEQIELATRMAFLIGTDFCCWAPIIIMGLLSLTGAHAVSPNVYVWTAVFILPLNSSLNPYLYTILTREMSKRKRKFGGHSIVSHSSSKAKKHSTGLILTGRENILPIFPIVDVIIYRTKIAQRIMPQCHVVECKLNLHDAYRCINNTIMCVYFWVLVSIRL